ncbi:hypothetical protein GCM10020331_045970 [Ectobacillus funiculus]
MYEGERERAMDEDIQLPKSAAKKQNVVSIEKAKQGAKVVLLEPRTYAEAQAIADHLKRTPCRCDESAAYADGSGASDGGLYERYSVRNRR